jgi:hypothetical protein
MEPVDTYVTETTPGVAVVAAVVVVVATSLVRLAKFGNSVLALKTPHSLRSTMQRETLP